MERGESGLAGGDAASRLTNRVTIVRKLRYLRRKKYPCLRGDVTIFPDAMH
jgi:hypothetical protein